jgi:hypothetical protein
MDKKGREIIVTVDIKHTTALFNNAGEQVRPVLGDIVSDIVYSDFEFSSTFRLPKSVLLRIHF